MNCFPDPDKHYYMFYKPFGCVTAHRDDLFPVVMDYFSELHNDRLSPVGRLDRETEGLLIVTDDGKWNQYMTNPEFHVPKTYEFAALGTLDVRKLQRLAEGVLLTGSNIPTKGADVTVTDTCVLSDILPLLHPDMQKKLRQGFGRAIRTEQDTCVVSILDHRAAKKGKYRGDVLDALPKCQMAEKIDEVEDFIRSRKVERYYS